MKQNNNKDLSKFFARSLYAWLFAIQMLIDIVYITLDILMFKNGVNIMLIIGTIILPIPNFIVIKNFIKFIWAHAMCVQHINDVRNSNTRTEARSGVPGSGKTSSAMFDKVITAKIYEEELRDEYFLYIGIDDATLSVEQLEHKKEVIEAYEFYMKNDTVPCLWTNIPVLVNGKYANKLTKNHLLQKERLPYKSVLFNDEIGNDFEATKKSATKLKPLSQLARFIRHFFDGNWTFTEQEFSKAFIDVRRTTGSVKYFLRQEWVLQPKLLIKFAELYKRLSMRNLYKAEKYEYGSEKNKFYMNLTKLSSELHSPFLRKLKRFIRNIGYRKYTYKELGNSETGVNITDDYGLVTFYLPSCLNATYDDRCYKPLYKCKDKEIKPFHFNGMQLTEEELKN